MINIKEHSGLPIKVDKNKDLIYSKEIEPVPVAIRTYLEMKDVLMQPQASGVKTNFYYMNRDVCFKHHQKTLRENNLRYDIIVIPPLKVGREFNKTVGHFHKFVPQTNLTYTEVYEVIYGEGIYLLQKIDGTDFIVVRAKAGDKVIVPPNYAHVTINPGREILVSSNWMARSSKSTYEAIKNKRGLMYYCTTEGFVKNKNYKNIPELREVKPTEVPEFGLSKEPMYFTPPEKLDFLKNPQNYLEIFERLYR